MTDETTTLEPQGYVLAVEDDAVSMMSLVSYLEDMGYQAIEATTGREALEIIERQGHKIDVLVLDKGLPDIDGLDIVAELKDNPKAAHIPVIMATGAEKPEEVKQGIDAGVFYYLIKPLKEEIFNSVMTSAMREVDRRKALQSDLKKHHSSFGFLKNADFEIRTLAEAEDLACFLANCFPHSDTALPGLAALLINAVEHGSLGIGYEEKTKLLEKGAWRQSVEERQKKDEYSDKIIRVNLTRSENETIVEIADEGEGFDWRRFMEIDPARALDNHGRGIAQANKISFDDLSYNRKGNIVTAISRSTGGIKW